MVSWRAPQGRMGLIAAGVLLVCLGCAGRDERAARKEGGVMTDPKTFMEVELNSFVRNRCSPPDQGPKWRGVAIEAPKRVWFQRGTREGQTRAFAAIPICGFYMLDVPFPPVEIVIRLVAVEKKSGNTYAGAVHSVDPSPDAPHPGRRPLRQEDVKGMASGQYFNPNLADFAGIPEEPGVYEVCAEVNGQRSNLVTIEVLEGAPR
jgi:hypothetical protein